jgi:hypothetical protein
MNPWRRLLASLALAVLSANFVGRAEPIPKSTTAHEGEPFHSFRLMDAELTRLSDQQAALAKALLAREVNSSARAFRSASVKAILIHMSSTVTAMERISRRLEGLYQTRRECQRSGQRRGRRRSRLQETRAFPSRSGGRR